MLQIKFRQAIYRPGGLLNEHISRTMTSDITYIFRVELSTSKYKRESLQQDGGPNFIRWSSLLLLTRDEF